MTLSPKPHRFAHGLRDAPVLDGGMPLQLDEPIRNRLGRHLEMWGLRKQEEAVVKWWPPPRGHDTPGNPGLWVPVGTPDPPEIKLPHPDDMTADERQLMREWLSKYDPDTEREL